MFGAVRSGRLASRALRLLPTTVKPANSAFFIPRRVVLTPIATRYLSSTSPYRQYGQYAVEEREYGDVADARDLGAEDISAAENEFTQFSQLAEAGVIDGKVIDTIVNKMGIHTMTEVQRMTLNECLDGTDVIAQARTGTGKTLAFLMPIVQRVLSDPDVKSRLNRPRIDDIRALVISPTRELAEQIAVEAKKIVQGTGLSVQTAVGGTQKSYHLRMMQQQGCHILVGTPGRVKDLLSDPYSGVRLDNIQTFVLDEADRLLDIGFGPDIEEIQRYMPARQERDRQTLMFSATIPRSVVSVVKTTMKPDFKFVRTIDPQDAATHEKVPQSAVFIPGLQNQIPTLVEIAQNAIEEHKRDPENAMPFKAIVFYSSVAEVHLAFEILSNLRDPDVKGGLFAPNPLAPCKIFHMSGQLDQRQRTMYSEGFRRCESGILVSSDVSARGMDFPNVSHVIQMGLPRSTEDYVHRLGRTGRAGKPGKGYLILVDDERQELNRLRKQIHAQNFNEESLATATLDMTQPSQLAPEVARIMRMVQSGVRATPNLVKFKTYQVLLSQLSQSVARRSKQQIVELANMNAIYGWGMETPPTTNPITIKKLGFEGVQGLTVGREFNTDVALDGRGGYGGRSRNGRSGGRRRNGFENSMDDPFGNSEDSRDSWSRGGRNGMYDGEGRSGRGGRGGGGGGRW